MIASAGTRSASGCANANEPEMDRKAMTMKLIRLRMIDLPQKIQPRRRGETRRLRLVLPRPVLRERSGERVLLIRLASRSRRRTLTLTLSRRTGRGEGRSFRLFERLDPVHRLALHHELNVAVIEQDVAAVAVILEAFVQHDLVGRRVAVELLADVDVIAMSGDPLGDV